MASKSQPKMIGKIKNTSHSVEGTDACAPEIEWLDDGVPNASAFNDTYFSRAGGLAETRHVFLGGNRLPDRWKGSTGFTIAELGFGTGLNFLATMKALRQSGHGLALTYISFELYPMRADQLTKALSAFPELDREAEVLVDNWAPRSGWNKIQFENVSLLLAIGDARQMVPGVLEFAVAAPAVDAWYLDGFSPSRNPQLWGEDLLGEVFKLTAPGGTLATYTAAGWVRRNLMAAGFHIEKAKGFAGKREMAVGSKPVP